MQFSISDRGLGPGLEHVINVHLAKIGGSLSERS
jgi:hypothetical protein